MKCINETISQLIDAVRNVQEDQIKLSAIVDTLASKVYNNLFLYLRIILMIFFPNKKRLITLVPTWQMYKIVLTLIVTFPSEVLQKLKLFAQMMMGCWPEENMLCWDAFRRVWTPRTNLNLPGVFAAFCSTQTLSFCTNGHRKSIIHTHKYINNNSNTFPLYFSPGKHFPKSSPLPGVPNAFVTILDIILQKLVACNLLEKKFTGPNLFSKLRVKFANASKRYYYDGAIFMKYNYTYEWSRRN